MTKRLTLMRHAQADNPIPDQQDWDRPLTKRGQFDAKEMARRMKARSLRPDLILSSPAIRTRQTTEFFTKCFASAQLLFIEELYLADHKKLLAMIRQHGAAAAHVLLVAHNPGIAELADALSSERSIDSMPTSAMVTAEFDVDEWRALQPATGVNVEFDYPQRSA